MNERYHYRVTFRKTDAARFIGHLDLQTLFQRALKRAKLPVAYSKGFNPHQLISFGMPLALGMTGLGEVVEVEMAQAVGPAEIIDALNAALPDGLRVLGARAMAEGEKAAAALICAAAYEMDFPEGGEYPVDVMARLMAQDEIMAEKKTKKGVTLTDVKPDILAARGADGLPWRLCVVLSAGGERNLKADVIAGLVLGGGADLLTVRTTRTRLLTAGGVCQ